MTRLKLGHFLNPGILGRYFNRTVMLIALLFVAWSLVAALAKLRDGPLSNERVIAQEQRLDEQAFTKIKIWLDRLHSPTPIEVPVIRDPFTTP